MDSARLERHCEAGVGLQDELNRFREQYSSEVLGDQARHFVQTKPAPENPMYEDEAKQFIGAVLDRWLRKKHDERRRANLGPAMP